MSPVPRHLLSFIGAAAMLASAQRLRILESPTDWVNVGAGGVLAAPQEARGA